jgi:hypothetical protein
MTRTPGAPAARNATMTVMAAAMAVAAVGFAGAAHAAPDPQNNGMHGDPAAAAPFWRYQQQNLDCGEMAVADVIGELTGNQPSEAEITATAANIPSTKHAGPIYTPSGRTSNRDLPVLLAHYGIASEGIETNMATLEGALDQGHKVIAGVNDRIIWNTSGDRSTENHFVVVTGIDTKAGVVHLNDSGARAGRDEQVSMAAFEAAWGTSGNFAVVTR